MLPLLDAAFAVEGAHHVVEPNEEYALIVDRRRAEQVRADPPRPLHVTGRRLEAIELPIARAEVDAIGGRNRFAGNAWHLVLPDGRTVLEIHRHDAPIVGRHIQAIAFDGGTAIHDPDRARPDDGAILCAQRADGRIGDDDQPTRFREQRSRGYAEAM